MKYSELYLINGITFTADYTHVVDFENISQQRAYFNSKKVGGFDTKCSYIRGSQNRFLINIPEIIVKQYSYITFKQYTPEGTSKEFYAFIMDASYSDENSTEITFQIDVWQTYQFEVTIKDAFIEREHQDRFSSLGASAQPIFNHLEENIEIGDELQISQPTVIKDEQDTISEDIEWLLIYSTERYGTSADAYFRYLGTLVPYMVYILPIVKYNGTHQIWLNTDRVYPEDIVNYVKDKGATIQILSIPYLPLNYTVTKDITNPSEPIFIFNFTGVTFTTDNVTIPVDVSRKFVSINTVTTIKENIYQFNKTYNITYTKTTPFSENNEPKLWLRPFKSYTIQGNNMTPLIFDEAHARARYLKYLCAFDINLKFRVYFHLYNGDYGKMNFQDVTNIPELTITREGYIQYLENQKNSAQNQMATNIIGAGVGALAIGAGIATGGVGIGLAFMGGGLAMGALQGITQQIAKEKDLKEMPTDIKNTGSNFLFNKATNEIKLILVERNIKSTYKTRVANFFHRFGYTAKKFGIPSLRTRYYFNYIKTTHIDITGNVNNNVIEFFKSLYNKGVTLWHYRNDNTNPSINNYTYENIEISLM